jgi:GNAT superfamily N-acetyltransferase
MCRDRLVDTVGSEGAHDASSMGGHATITLGTTLEDDPADDDIAAWRGRGIGRALLRAAEDRARERGCRQVVLFTHAFQTPGLYVHSGYDLVGEVEDYPAGSAAYWFRKRLGGVAFGVTPPASRDHGR